METWYWVFEYGKVFFSYMFLMFLWPSVVFGGHLRKKTKTYRFSFCVTVQIVVVNTVVLVLGIFHVLNRWMILLAFYGMFALVFLKRARQHINSENMRKVKVYRLSTLRVRWKEYLSGFWHIVRWLLVEHGLLLVVIVFGMIYFSYGAFQVHSYGYGDLHVHHDWINGLKEGRIFSGGVYPAAMHCFVYCLNTLFGVRVYSILLFLQSIHVAVLFVSAYIMLREVFNWRYTPLFVFAVFLTLDLVNADQIQSMFRLQITLPQEFCLHTVFLCAFYLITYLKSTNFVLWKDKLSKCCWDENLFLFMMSLSAALMTHFHTTIMAFLVCASFAVFALKTILNWKYLIPLLASVLCSCLVSITPMAVALASGMPFNDSITWAVNAMNGEESRSMRKQEEVPEKEEEADTGMPDIERKEISIASSIVKFFIDGRGYADVYGTERAQWILLLTFFVLIFCYLVHQKHRSGFLDNICSRYFPVILASILYILVYEAPMIGLPDIIPEGRFFVPGHMMVLSVIVMPVDVIFSVLSLFCWDCILKVLSAFSMIGIYAAMVITGNYRGYLFYELIRYDSAVSVTKSIIDTFPRHSYTIVSPTDELYPMMGCGWHEELLNFVEQCDGDVYTLPSEYVFVYVEKRPLLYAQCHFLQGPSWLGSEKYLEPYWKTYSRKYPDGGASQSPEIIVSEVSESEARKEIPEYTNSWLMYKQIDNRTILESKAYEWCQDFSKQYPLEMNVYYEDDDFVCYYFRQDTNALYNLALGME